MAYITQEQKKEIAGLLKTFMPTTWKYSLSIKDYSCLEFNLKSAPIDLLKLYNDKSKSQLGCENPTQKPRGYLQLTQIDCNLEVPLVLKSLFEKINNALNLNNFNNSNAQIDYFDVGYYIRINIGNYSKPFICTI